MTYDGVRKRDELPALLNKLGYREGAEIGVQRGKYSLKLCKGIPGLHLYCVDAWKRYDKVRRQATQDAYFAETQAKLAAFNVTYVRKWSMDAVRHFKDGSLDFVYIDGNHKFDFIMQDIIEWSKKVRPGGIVAGHDYFEFPSGQGGVVQAVDVYTQVHHIEPVYFTDDREVTFFWFKP